MVILSGPIDTPKEIKAVLDILEQEKYLTQKVSEAEINTILFNMKAWRSNRLEGPVDTPREVEVLLNILRKSQLLVVGAIDTPAEVQLFMEKLQQQGFFQLSNKNIVNQNIQNEHQHKPHGKKPRNFA